MTTEQLIFGYWVLFACAGATVVTLMILVRTVMDLSKAVNEMRIQTEELRRENTRRSVE